MHGNLSRSESHGSQVKRDNFSLGGENVNATQGDRDRGSCCIMRTRPPPRPSLSKAEAIEATKNGAGSFLAREGGRAERGARRSAQPQRKVMQ